MNLRDFIIKISITRIILLNKTIMNMNMKNKMVMSKLEVESK